MQRKGDMKERAMFKTRKGLWLKHGVCEREFREMKIKRLSCLMKEVL